MADFQPLSKARRSRLRKLGTRKGREELGAFLAEGPHLVAEAFEAGLRFRALVLSETAAEADDLVPEIVALADTEGLLFGLPDAEFKEAASTENPQGVLAEFSKPEARELSELTETPGLLLVLDEIQDPGNLGAAIRSAAGLGCVGAIPTKGCADLWNPKTLRATAGAAFRLPITRPLEVAEARDGLDEAGFAVWVAEADGVSIFEKGSIPENLALVFGNESRGPNSGWKFCARFEKIGLPLANGVESLNVGAAVAAMLGALAAFR